MACGFAIGAASGGLLQAEMRTVGAAIVGSADAAKVPAGNALAVDRDEFSARVTRLVQDVPLSTDRTVSQVVGEGLGDLDECNGRFGPTPEFPQGIYHYHVTATFPFVSRLWKGKGDVTFEKQGPPPGARPRKPRRPDDPGPTGK